MSTLEINKSTLKGKLAVPPSKSHTLRAILFAMLAEGKSVIERPLPSPDIEAMIKAATQFGARCQKRGNLLFIEGGFGPAEDVIQAGNSGIVLRFLGGIAGLLPTYTVLTGDASIRHRRPVKPLLEGLEQLGAFATSTRLDDYAPIVIRGPIKPGKIRVEGRDSQPISALLMATSLLPGKSEIVVDHPGETPWIDLTLHWLEKMGHKIQHENYTHYFVEGGGKIAPFHYNVPGDFSTAAFPLAAALITGSKLELTNLSMSDPQGDKALLTILKSMGANLQFAQHLKISPSKLQGQKIDMNACIDALPILAVLGCFAEGETELFNASISREKESDRIGAICSELKKMGATISETETGLIVKKSALKGAEVFSHGDHRVAMALSVAALGASGTTHVEGIKCIQKTYPQFVADFQRIGAEIELDSVWV